MLAPFKLPGVHVYVTPPPAVNVELWPTQIAVGLDTTVIVGNGLTVTATVFEPVQPAVFVPTTV